MKKITLAALMAVSSLSLSVHAGPIFTIESLGTLGGDSSTAFGLNENGQVVGWSDNGNGQQEAFVWDATNGIQGLGTLGGNRAWAYDINNAGQIVGHSETGRPNQPEGMVEHTNGFIYQGGVMNSLIDVSGDGPNTYTFTRADRINENGQIVGTRRVNEYDPITGEFTNIPETESFLWDGGIVETSSMQWTLGINNDGSYVGRGVVRDDLVNYPDTGGQARPAALKEQGESIQYLGTLGGFSAYGFDINDNGVVVGRSRVELTSSFHHAFLYSEDTGMVDMGTFGFTNANLRSINNNNWALGWGSDNFETVPSEDFIFSPFILNLETDELFYLNDFLTDSSEFISIDFGYSLNENNDIVGYGTTRDGRREAFLMSFQGFQIPEPSAYLLMLMGLAGIGVARRRKH